MIRASDKENELTCFVEELTRHQGDLKLIIRGLCGDPDAVDDIQQSVNVVLWKKRNKFQIGTSFKSWAFRVAQTEVKAYFRETKKRKEFLFKPEVAEIFSKNLESLGHEVDDRAQALRRCLTKLSSKDYQLIQHRYWGEARLKSLAEARGRSLGTLKARLHQLRQKLKVCVSHQLKSEI